MNKAAPSKPGTSVSTRRSTTSQSMQRPIGSRHQLRSAPQPEIKPAQVHELKLQTQQLKQQTKVLRSQLARTQDQINSHTNAINKTFEQSSEKTSSNTIHESTIPNLRRNLDGAKNTLELLEIELKYAINDDRTSNVEELEEELKITYCEYKRLAKELKEKKAEANYLSQMLAQQEYRASNAHIQELRMEVRDIRAENATLRDKANAYQTKIEKFKIESEIANHQQNKIPTQKTLEQLEIIRAENNQKMSEMCEKLNQESEEHEQKVGELQQIIDDLKEKIRVHLEEGQQQNETN